MAPDIFRSLVQSEPSNIRLMFTQMICTTDFQDHVKIDREQNLIYVLM